MMARREMVRREMKRGSERLGLGLPNNYPDYQVFPPIPDYVTGNQGNCHKIIVVPKNSLT